MISSRRARHSPCALVPHLAMACQAPDNSEGILGGPTETQIAAARELIGKKQKIIAIWSVREEEVKEVARNVLGKAFVPLVVIPFFWPIMLFSYYGMKASLAGTMYVLTDKILYRMTNIDFAGGNSGVDSAEISLDKIGGVGVNNPGTLFGKKVFPYASITLSVPLGDAMANFGGGSQGSGNRRIRLRTTSALSSLARAPIRWRPRMRRG